MSIVWKILRVVGLYVVFFFVSIIIAATALDNLPDAFEALFALFAPAVFVWWYEKSRAARTADKVDSKSAAHFLTTSQAEYSTKPKPYQSKQNYAELVRVGQQEKAALEAAAERRSAEKLARQEQTRRILNQPLQTERQRKSSPARSHGRHQGWVPKGQSVTIAGRTIYGMVYVGSPPQIGSSYYGESCRAYIDPSLSVARVGSNRNGDGMSYWPGYSNIPAVCRATYLDWLAGGRQDGTINPGYMFLFFYGLERRFLVEQPTDDEKQEIIAEVERLKALFSHNYSAQRYLGEFLDIARIMAMGGISLDDATLKQAIFENRSWDLPFSLKFALGGMIDR